MIWIKRALPFVIILIIWFGYGLYEDYQLKNKAKNDKKYAEVTALVWVASAKYRANPEEYLKYRDSLMSSYGLNIEKAHQFIDDYKKAPEKLGLYANLVKIYIDSLIAIEDSTRKVDTAKSTKE